MRVNHASVNRSLGSAGQAPADEWEPAAGSAATGSSASATRAGSRANTAAWLLVAAFVLLVLSVAVPAMSHGDRADLAALLFMAGLAATFVGTAMALAASLSKARTVFGALVMLAGLVLMYGIVPSLAALGVILVGAALQIGSLPGE